MRRAREGLPLAAYRRIIGLQKPAICRGLVELNGSDRGPLLSDMLGTRNGRSYASKRWIMRMRFLSSFQEPRPGDPAPQAKFAIVEVQQQQDRGMVLDRKRAAEGDRQKYVPRDTRHLADEMHLGRSRHTCEHGARPADIELFVVELQLVARLDLGVPDRGKCGLEGWPSPKFTALIRSRSQTSAPACSPGR